MSDEIFEWKEIKDSYKDGAIILGNGASMALTNTFNYKNLKEKACDSGFMDKKVQELFTAFDTNDFEAVLRLVWQARTVNKTLKISDYQGIEMAYTNIRECLIQTIRQFHPSYESVEDKFVQMHNFLFPFKTVIY